MAELKLDLDSIGELDAGMAKMAINHAIRTAIHDLDERGRDGKPREVVIKLVMHKLENGMPVIRVLSDVKMPPFSTAETIGLLRMEGTRAAINFQALDPKNPHQRTIDEVIPNGQS